MTPFRTANGGALLPTDPGWHAVQIPKPAFNQNLLVRPLRAAVTDLVAEPVPDYLARYFEAYHLQFQGPSGVCTGCGATVLMMACSLHQGTPMPQESEFEAYYMATGDTTFSRGSGLSWVVGRAKANGVCADSLYSEAYVLSHWQNGGPYPLSMLPTQPAYDDAATRKVVEWSSPYPPGAYSGPTFNATFFAQLVRSGIFVGIQVGNHIVVAAAVDNDNWWWKCIDSEIGNNVSSPGLPPGVRYFTTDLLVANCFEAVIVTQVDPGAPIIIHPSGGGVTLAETIAAIAANKPYSASDYAQLQAAVAAASPTPPAPPVQVPPAASVTDSQGHVWSLGAVSQYGKIVLRDGVAWFSGQASLIDYRNGLLKMQNSRGDWWQPTVTGWVGTTAPQ